MANNCVDCNNCGHIGWSKPKGSFFFTIVLALFFILPAIIYEIWRRVGLGVCENCSSSAVKPSNVCRTQRKTDIGSIITILVLGIAGAFIVVLLYGFIDGVVNGSHVNAQTNKNIQDQCLAKGLKHYQEIGQYPTLPNGVETSTYVLNECKNTLDGKYKTP